MKKIKCLFERDYETGKLMPNKFTPEADWVIQGEGLATRKFDGTSCLIREGVLYKRYDAKNGKIPPFGFIPAQDPDPITGHWPGWLKVGAGPEDKWHREAFNKDLKDNRTYELCGPKIQNNAEGLDRHILIEHGNEILEEVPTEYFALKEYLSNKKIEGIVWHHPDGRMIKIKKKDL